jgi:REP element-mobilizing transposase RayT
MPHSHSRIAVHLIFSTKNRCSLISDDIRGELHAYIIGILRNMDCPSIITNSTADYVHVLFLLSRKQMLEHVVEEVKRSSSKWLKSKDQRCADSHWQVGYAAFSVGQDDIDSVSVYIKNQKEHHSLVSFTEEIRAIFARHSFPLDEHLFE